MHWITEVKYIADYRLRLQFEDGRTRVVDLAEHLTGDVFEPLKDRRLFKTARLNPDLDTVVWDNGADMSPDFLYEIGVLLAADSRRVHQVAETPAQYGTAQRRPARRSRGR